jgi:hypothetical protein
MATKELVKQLGEGGGSVPVVIHHLSVAGWRRILLQVLRLVGAGTKDNC